MNFGSIILPDQRIRQKAYELDQDAPTSRTCGDHYPPLRRIRDRATMYRPTRNGAERALYSQP